ncbi:MAG: hypothetical protein M1837_005339 [Sclerophora amabilis]|nr:MAG: hypothetical protein M1837_005339 [Sclerophora amabilis]
MAPNPSTPTRQPANRRSAKSTPSRRPTLVDAFHGRGTTRRRASNDLHDRAAVTAELRRQTTILGQQTGQSSESSASNGVQDRIRKWQAQGGGVIEQPDPVVYPPEATPVLSEVSTEKGKGDDIDVGDTAHRRRKRRSKEADAVADENAAESHERSESKSSAPRRRVISDSHWRKRTSSAKDAPKSGSGRDTVIDDGIRVTPTRAEPHVKKVRKDKRDVPLQTRGDESGARPHQTPERGSENLTPKFVAGRSSGSRSGERSEEDRPSSRTTPSPPRKGESGGRRRKASGDCFRMSGGIAEEDLRMGKTKIQHKEKTPDRSPRSSPATESTGRQKRQPSGSKASILKEVYDEGKKIFSKPEPNSANPVPGNSIEAWLSGTPDPFVDSQVPNLKPVPSTAPSRTPDKARLTDIGSNPQSTISPSGSLKKRGARNRISDQERTLGNVPSSQSPESATRDTGRRASDRLTSNRTKTDQKGTNITTDVLSLSSPTLKRTGARRGPNSPTRRKESASLVNDAATEDKLNRSSPGSGPDEKSLDKGFEQPVKTANGRSKRAFPTTGEHVLSTIASVETFSTVPKPQVSHTMRNPPAKGELTGIGQKDDLATETQDTFDPELPQIPGKKTSLKRRLTTHADLISVLSLPREGSKSIRSARSIRTNRSRLGTANIDDLLHELATDESKYMRELNTLVDGVIPVLLTCVLSKSDSAIAAGLFSSSANKNDPNVTRPIIDMGIALERLKTLHKRIPLQSPDQLLSWANRGHKAYSEYIKCYRMGFQDVVVNLAPGSEGGPEPSAGSDTAPSRDSALDEGLPRNAEGDVVNGDGERVDVAFLLKRPLVRLKYLAKTFKVGTSNSSRTNSTDLLQGINHVRQSFLAKEISERYESLVADARRRSNEEKGRLEDEAAANTDPTRARDLRTLALMTNVTVESNRRVKARDVFNLALQHSSGQRVDCKIEFLLRDDADPKSNSGDLLICEIDGTGRWLLFPPVMSGRVSARNGEKKGEIVVMIRGRHGDGQEWQELLVLTSDDEQAGFEWVQMLGLTPVPPGVVRQSSFVRRKHQSESTSDQKSTSSAPLPVVTTTMVKSRTPSPREIEIPIGEQAMTSRKPEQDILPVTYDTPEKHVSDLSVLGPRDSPRPSTPVRDRVESDEATPSRLSSRSSSLTQELAEQTTPKSLNDAMIQAGHDSRSGLRRTRAHRRSRHVDDSPTSPKSRFSGYIGNMFKSTSPTKRQSVKSDENVSDREFDLSKLSPKPTTSRQEKDHIISSSDGERSERDKDRSTVDQRSRSKSPLDIKRPQPHQRNSSAPAMDSPALPKLRKSAPSTPVKSSTGDEESQAVQKINTVIGEKASPNVLKKSPPPSKETLKKPRHEDSPPPAPPPHRTPSPVSLDGKKTPKIKSSASKGEKEKRRRSSSPLKHQYEPSSESDSSSASDISLSEHDGDSDFTSSSEDEDLEEGDVPTPLLPLGALHRFSRTSQKGSMYSQPNNTITPSQSASQAPYKHVPPQPTQASKTIASIYCWSDEGRWDQVHPDECSVVVTPGLIEAYEMSASHSKPMIGSFDGEPAPSSPSPENGERPLVGLELTPLVPLRRGTALDISIRSPPTAESQLTTGNNIMFRSRNPEECEALYALINTSRINNPTYIALQNARGSYGNGIGSGMGRRGSSRRSSWWGFGNSRRNSYRASSTRTSSVAMSESSVGSLSSAFSALRRFGNGGRSFNISKSTIDSRGGSRTTSVYSSSSNSSLAKDGTDTPPDLSKGSPIGLSNAKIRIYQRETASKWRDMGSARLSITRPPPSFDRHGLVGNEKRILVHGKTAGEVLLDVCLGESCFERVARTGIALSVWEEVVGPNGEIGQVGAVGGVGGKTRVYMIQMKSEAETAYTFSLVGKLRY